MAGADIFEDIRSRHEQQAADAKAAAHEYDAYLGSLRRVMATNEGRRVLWYLVSLCHPFQGNPFTDGRVQRFEGQRDMGVKLVLDMKLADLKTFHAMEVEQMVRDRNQQEKGHESASREG
jgi:hypothetical protein